MRAALKLLIHVPLALAAAIPSRATVEPVSEGVGAVNLIQKSVFRTPQSQQLNVAYAVFITEISSDGWRDAIDVLAFGIKKAVAKSKHHIDLLALTPRTLPKEDAAKLRKAGFLKVLQRDAPVDADDVQQEMAREHMQRIMGTGASLTFLQSHETIKYWGLALTDYDRVLVLDADTMVLDPMDELMEREEDFVGTYDHGLDIDESTMPPTQGGFLLFRPNMTDFEAVEHLTREGDWGGGGWKHSGIGYCYGGVGPDGLLSYYFSKDALPNVRAMGKKHLPEGIDQRRVAGSRALYVERPVYDIVLNERLRTELLSADHDKTLANAKSVHFTGDCIKPWTCASSSDWFCAGLMEKWWDLRDELAASRGQNNVERGCSYGRYQPLRAS